MGGTGGNESLKDLCLVPQSVLMVKWEDETMNGKPPLLHGKLTKEKADW